MSVHTRRALIRGSLLASVFSVVLLSAPAARVEQDAQSPEQDALVRPMADGTTQDTQSQTSIAVFESPTDSDPESPEQNVLVNNPGTDGTAQDTQSETTITAFGSTIVVGFNDSGSRVGMAPHFTGYARSIDGGATFVDMGTLPDSPNGDAGDPVLARDDVSGTIYFATLQISGSGRIQVFRSFDDGATFQLPVNGTPGKSGLQDKEWITVDNFLGAGRGNVYLIERDFGAGNGIYFFRSTDGGATFGPNGGFLIASGSGGNVQGAWVTVGPDHAVYTFFFDQRGALPQTIKMRKSTDRGVTFGPEILVTTLATTMTNGGLGLTGRRVGLTTFAGFRSNAFPQVVVNPLSGHLYLTYNDNPPGTDKGDIFFRLSTDGGATWGAPVRVNSDATTNDQWQPTIAVTPDASKVGVFWYDRRADPENNLIDYFGRIGVVSGSTVTFGADFAVTDAPFPPEFGRDPVVNPVYMGDYDHAQADNAFFYVTWGDNRDPSIFVPTRNQANVRFKKILHEPSGNLLVNPGFESGILEPWVSWGVAGVADVYPHNGTYHAWVYPFETTSGLFQLVTAPSSGSYTFHAYVAEGNLPAVGIGITVDGVTVDFAWVVGSDYAPYTVTAPTVAAGQVIAVFLWADMSPNGWAVIDTTSLTVMP